MTEDITDNMINDQDLLNILGVSDSEESERVVNKSDDEKDADRKIEELKEIASKMSSSLIDKNSGSGDIDKDLSNWFDGVDALPSDPLNNYISNATIKMDYGLSKNVLSSYQLMGKLRKFLEEDCFSMIFSESALMGCDPEEVLDRAKAAFTMYKELASINAKVINDMKNYRIKTNTEGADTEKLTLLLGSIPNDKLEEMLQKLAYNKK